MSILVKGNELPFSLQTEVLRAYVHRWTHENARQTYNDACPACIQGKPTTMTVEQWHKYHNPMITDQEWLAAHAFYVTKRNTLDARRHFAKPAYLVD